jgi:hypothetical protein
VLHIMLITSNYSSYKDRSSFDSIGYNDPLKG